MTLIIQVLWNRRCATSTQSGYLKGKARIRAAALAESLNEVFNSFE
jgi:hypothetical protein